MFEPVFISRDTEQIRFVTIVPARIGIVKIKGCLQFVAAIKDVDGEYGYVTDSTKEKNSTTLPECKRLYGSVPNREEAWLVEEGRKYINWLRVDQDLHLLNADGSIVTK